MLLNKIMKKFLIKTHGCKSNQLESEVIKEKLTAAGYLETTNPDEADIFILNSCSVTENADNEALRTIRHIKNKHKNIYTVLTGCSAQLNYEKIKELGLVDLILGNNDKFEIVSALKRQENIVNDIFETKSFNNQTIHNYFKTRGYVKIQDGCNNYCSYCTIPLARGKSRSNSEKNILEQIKIYTDSGIKEIVLTGIHIGQWGMDFNDNRELLNLLEKIEETDIIRYRLGSLNTIEVNDRLLDFLSQSQKFCPHFHMSLQSLNDKTLSSMNRHYSAKSCLELMKKIDDIFNKPFIGSDIIVGFPGESEADFDVTYNNALISKLSNIHVFPYSVRNNTKAAQMDGQISFIEKQKRADILHKLAQKKYNDFINKNIGTTSQLLVEKRPDKKTGCLKGVTKNYLTVYLEEKDLNLCNTIQNIKILSLDDNKKLLAKIL